MPATMFNQTSCERDMSAEIRISIRVEAADIVSATNNKINVILLKDEKSQDYVPLGSQSPKPSKKIYSRATTIPPEADRTSTVQDSGDGERNKPQQWPQV